MKRLTCRTRVVPQRRERRPFVRMDVVIWAALAFLLSFGIPCLAQVRSQVLQGLPKDGAPRQDQGEKSVFGLQELIRRAIQTSPELAQRRSESAAARYDIAQARAGYYPQLETLTVVGPVNNTRRLAVSNGRIIDPSADLSVGLFGRTELTLAQPLYTFGKLSNSREAAVRGAAASRYGEIRTGNDIALRVKELYYGLVLARVGVRAAQEADGFFNEARDRLSRLLEAGSENVVESDVFRIDAYRSDTIRLRAEAEKGEKVAYFALKAMIGVAETADFSLADESLPVAKGELGKPDAYIRKALADRPELKQLEEGIAARSALVEAARSDLYPSIFAAAYGSFAGAPGRQAFHNPYIFDDFNHVIGGVVGGMKWHFDFGIVRARIDKAQEEKNGLTHTRSLARLMMPVQVAKDYEDALQWRASIDAYSAAATSSRKWVVSAMSSFDMGTGTADDLLRAIERYGQNRGRYLEAVFNYNMALAQLDHDTGVKDW